MENLMKSVESIPALFGATQNGGGKKKYGKKAKSSKSSKKVSKSGKKVYKSKKSRSLKRPIFGFRYFGGADQFLCTKIESTGAAAPPTAQPAAPMMGSILGPKPVQPIQPVAAPAALVGGKKAKKMATVFKRYNNMTVEKLVKLAARKGIKVYKKKNGKTVQVKKATLVRKLCDRKMRKYAKK